MGYTDIDVRISETGWPTKGDDDEPGANPMNAAIYNGNLLQRIAANRGTPLKPAVPIDIVTSLSLKSQELIGSYADLRSCQQLMHLCI